MRFRDAFRFSAHAIASHRLRSFLTTLGIAIGIASVILLTSIGKGVQGYILGEFTQFGTNLLAIAPGRTTTLGMSGAVISNVRPLSIDDGESLRRLPQVLATVPVVQGNAPVETGGRQRRATVLGTGAAAPRVWQFPVALGSFLPADDPRAARAFAVLGSKVRRELYGTANPLGSVIRVGGSRFRVIGVMESKGQILGFDLDDTVYIPTARALELFNRESLMEIDILFEEAAEPAAVAAAARRALIARHGSEDFTITTQDQMLDILGDVLGKLTLAVAALGAISLLVGGVGILTIMTIAVLDRTAEVGLLRSLGAGRATILRLFLQEALLLSLLGGTAGLALGLGGAGLLHLLLPALPTRINLFFILLALAVAAFIGLAAGVLPARRAATLDPVEALRAE